MAEFFELVLVALGGVLVVGVMFGLGLWLLRLDERRRHPMLELRGPEDDDDACGIGQGMSAPRTNTRQFCHRCNAIDRVGFLAPKELWRLVAGPRWEHDILCLACFAEIGDEKGIEWDVAELEFYPVSYVTLNRDRGVGQDA